MKLPHPRLGFLLVAALASPAITFSQPAEKPVPVLAEPNHKVALENAWLRVIDVHFPPGQTTLYHVHTIPSVVVELSDATIVSQEWGAAPGAPRATKPGESRYAPYDEKPLTHRVTNRGPGLFHVLDIELLRSPAVAATPPPAASANLKLEWEQKLARLYELTVAAGKSTEVEASGCAHLLIGVSGTVQTSAGASAAGREVRAGEYAFFPPQSGLRIDNRNSGSAACILLELK